jgi:anaerobic selenocysteine-containing dehydrogenase
VALRGNREHPFTRGSLCAKVNSYLEFAASPDRLLHPLRRVGRKGVGRFERVTWEEAIDGIAGAIRDAIATDGGQSIWPFVGTGTVTMIQGTYAGQRLWNALGASHHDLDICSVAGHVGMSYTAGSAMGLDPEEIAHAGLVLLWGTNTLTSNLHLWPVVSAARRRGAPLVVVDPVRTRTAARADLHLAVRPGTDAALALGVMAELVKRGAADEEYLARWSTGWPLFRDGVLAAWDAAQAAAECGLPLEQVTALVDLVVDHRPLAIRTLMGVQRHRGGGQALRVLSCLPAVTGDYARRGGGLVYSTETAYRFDVAALTRPGLRPVGPSRRLRMSGLGRHLLEETDPPITVLVVMAANLVVSNPDQNRVRAGLAREDLVTVVIDHVRTPTTDYADYVLPGTTQLEHLDVHDSYSHLYVNLNSPAVPPPGEALPHTEIFRRLATALGLTRPELHADDEELAADLLGSGHPALAGITLASLRERGWQRLGHPTPYRPFALGFPTASGRFEFASDRAERDGLGRLPGYTPPAEASGPADDGSVALLATANHYLINSTFSTSPRHTKRGTTTVELHPLDAAAAGVADGQAVEVGNARGSFRAVASVTDAVRPGVARTSRGLVPGGSGETSANATTSDAAPDVGRGAVFHDNRVTVTPASA